MKKRDAEAKPKQNVPMELGGLVFRVQGDDRETFCLSSLEASDFGVLQSLGHIRHEDSFISHG